MPNEVQVCHKQTGQLGILLPTSQSTPSKSFAVELRTGAKDIERWTVEDTLVDVRSSSCAQPSADPCCLWTLDVADEQSRLGTQLKGTNGSCQLGEVLNPESKNSQIVVNPEIGPCNRQIYVFDQEVGRQSSYMKIHLRLSCIDTSQGVAIPDKQLPAGSKLTLEVIKSTLRKERIATAKSVAKAGDAPSHIIPSPSNADWYYFLQAPRENEASTRCFLFMLLAAHDSMYCYA